MTSQAKSSEGTAKRLVLLVAAVSGFCAMSYEVLWFRILRHFVDNSIHSFGILLTTFLCGLALGGLVFSKLADSRKDPLLVLGGLQIGIGLLCMLSVPLISHTNERITELVKIIGETWNAQLVVRFIVFSAVMLLPTTLMGGVFPVASRIYAAGSPKVGRSIGELYAVNTLGCVLGSFAAGFVLLPGLGIQSSIASVSLLNLAAGIVVVWRGSGAGGRIKPFVCGGAAALCPVLWLAVPSDAFLGIYSQAHPAPEYELLYLRENINGTAAVFQDSTRKQQKYFLIDGRGEVSTDYFSMRAFRFLGLLPALYAPQTNHALIVTFGSGIVAGTIAGLPGLERADCVEICDEAFEAAEQFKAENHDVLHNPRLHRIVNDGRNHVLTTSKRYDIISADATHPASSDSWALYTKEFYELCRDRLTDGGVMSQWMPLHGMLESDYQSVLKTFHSVFPFVALYYSGGHKTIGHTVVLGSNKPLTIDYKKARRLLADHQIKEDLARVNIPTLYDILNGFVTDQDSFSEWLGSAQVNTDDRPVVIFSKSKLPSQPYFGLGPVVRYRKCPTGVLSNVDSEHSAEVQLNVKNACEAMGYTVQGQLLEFEEFMARSKVDLETPGENVAPQLQESRSKLEETIRAYSTALEINPNDPQTLYLLRHVMNEYRELVGMLEKMGGKRR